MNVLTVVVTFNRYDLLTECLNALLSQTHSTTILVVDNASTDGTNVNIKNDGYLKHSNLIYQRLEQNLGGAGGFHYGVKYAQEKKFDYVWLMDDDAEPELNGLELLLKKVNNKYSAYAPMTLIGTKEEHTISLTGHGHRGYFDYENCFPSFQKPVSRTAYKKDTYEIDMASFVGILIPFESVKKIGLPEQRFFIHHDDTEYSLRLRKLGKILMVNNSKIYHKEKRQEEKYIRSFLWFKKNRVRYENLWLKYFGLRNSVFIALKYGRGLRRYFLMTKVYFQLIKDIILYDDNKLVRLKFATHSVLDGLRGHFDNTKPSKILGKD